MGRRELKKKTKILSHVESIARLYDAKGNEKSLITGSLFSVDKKTLGVPL